MGKNMFGKNVIRFVRAGDDFPCGVSVGGRLPAWEIKRWGDRRHENKIIAPEARLRFAPDGEDDFTVRGGSNTVLYRGRNVSHRWTLLGGNDFEYDVILKKPPASNVISLTLEGAELFDFFRQPASARNPFLSGSYAVYLKDTFIGQGTGKMCHIYRPKIIDASGNSVWGDLRIAGNKLFIAIPENFLSTAAYPVLVDPVVGCSSAGTRTEWDPWGDEDEYMRFAEQIPVNKYTAPANINGRCAAFFYDWYEYRSYTHGSHDYPVLYSDSNNFPKYKKTSGETGLTYPATNNAPGGWLGAEFTVNDSVPAGAPFWFGLFAEDGWHACYDWGGNLFVGSLDYDNGIGHEEYPPFSVKWGERYDIRLSMYFEFSQARHHVRTITHGVSVSDSNSVKLFIRRVLVSGAAAFQGAVKCPVIFVRRIADGAAALLNVTRSASCKRFVYDTAQAVSNGARASLGFVRKIAETAAVRCLMSRRLAVVIG
jgi:hypothetical protein